MVITIFIIAGGIQCAKVLCAFCPLPHDGFQPKSVDEHCRARCGGFGQRGKEHPKTVFWTTLKCIYGFRCSQ